MAQTNATKAFAQACSYCHSRKVKCVPTGRASCQTCEENGVKCRLRRPKQLGRPRGGSQSAFPCQKQGLISYKSSPSRRSHRPSTDVKPSFSSSNQSSVSRPYEPPAPAVEIPLSPFFQSSADQRQGPPKSMDPVKPIEWSPTSPDAMKHLSYTQSFFNSPGDASPTEPGSAVGNADLPLMNMAFEDLFAEGRISDSPCSGTSLPSFPTLFSAYLEAHEALSALRSGSYELPLSDLKDDRGAMGSITKISELGTKVVNSNALTSSPIPGSNDQYCLQLAFLAAVKGCELAEQISLMVLPTTAALHASSMDFPVIKSPYGSKPAECQAIDEFWNTEPFLPSEQSRPSTEHIVALVRLDVQLSQLNCFMSRFIQSAPEHMPLADILAARCRRRLSYLHTQIRGVVDSLIPAWD